VAPAGAAAAVAAAVAVARGGLLGLGAAGAGAGAETAEALPELARGDAPRDGVGVAAKLAHVGRTEAQAALLPAVPGPRAANCVPAARRDSRAEVAGAHAALVELLAARVPVVAGQEPGPIRRLAAHRREPREARDMRRRPRAELLLPRAVEKATRGPGLAGAAVSAALRPAARPAAAAAASGPPCDAPASPAAAVTAAAATAAAVARRVVP